MKAILIGLMVVALSAAVLADHRHIDALRTDESVYSGSQLRAYVNLGSGAQSDYRIKVFMPDLGLYRSAGPFGDDSNNGHSVYLDIPEDVESGEYVVRVSVKDDEHSVTRHRFVWID